MVTDWLKKRRLDWWQVAPRGRKSRRSSGATVSARVQSLEPRVMLSATPLGSEFRVNAFTTSSQFDTHVGMDADGDFVIAWFGNGQDGSYDIFAQRYNAAGMVQGSEFQVNTYTGGSQSNPTVPMGPLWARSRRLIPRTTRGRTPSPPGTRTTRSPLM